MESVSQSGFAKPGRLMNSKLVDSCRVFECDVEDFLKFDEFVRRIWFESGAWRQGIAKIRLKPDLRKLLDPSDVGVMSWGGTAGSSFWKEFKETLIPRVQVQRVVKMNNKLFKDGMYVIEKEQVPLLMDRSSSLLTTAENSDTGDVESSDDVKKRAKVFFDKLKTGFLANFGQFDDTKPVEGDDVVPECLKVNDFFKFSAAMGQLHPNGPDHGWSERLDPNKLPTGEEDLMFDDESGRAVLKLKPLEMDDEVASRDTRAAFWSRISSSTCADGKGEVKVYVTELSYESDMDKIDQNLTVGRRDEKKPFRFDLMDLKSNLLGLLGCEYVKPEVILGVNTPFFFLGVKDSVFPMHLEDMELISVNMLIQGYPKIWYGLSAEDVPRFERFVGDLPAGDDETEPCQAVGRHKRDFYSEEFMKDFRYKTFVAVQHPWELIVTFPKGYHWGFNTGFNINVATNYALKEWIDYGIRVRHCECLRGEVDLKLCMEPFLRKCYPLEAYKAWLTGNASFFGEVRKDLRMSGVVCPPTVPTLDALLKVRIPDSSPGQGVDSGEDSHSRSCFLHLQERITQLKRVAEACTVYSGRSTEKGEVVVGLKRNMKASLGEEANLVPLVENYVREQKRMFRSRSRCSDEGSITSASLSRPSSAIDDLESEDSTADNSVDDRVYMWQATALNMDMEQQQGQGGTASNESCAGNEDIVIVNVVPDIPDDSCA